MHMAAAYPFIQHVIFTFSQKLFKFCEKNWDSLELDCLVYLEQWRNAPFVRMSQTRKEGCYVGHYYLYTCKSGQWII